MSLVKDKVFHRKCPFCDSMLVSVGKIRKDKTRVIRCSECYTRWDEVP